MALGPAATQPPRPVAPEKWVKLAGEAEPSFHGTLTSHLHGLLEGIEPGDAPFGDLERALREALGDDYAVRVSDAGRGRLVLADRERGARATALIATLDERPVRECIARLEHAVERHKEQGDYWPEGRLSLGIAYACLGEYEAAKEWLEEATNMLRYPSYVARSDQVAA